MASRPTFVLVALWAGAAGLAVGVATAGVNLVANKVTEPLPVVLDDPASLATQTPGSPDASPTNPTPSHDASAAATSAASEGATGSPSASTPPTGPTPRSTIATTPVPAPSPSASQDDDPSSSPSSSESDDDDEPSPQPSQSSDDDQVGEETRTVSSIGGQASFHFKNGTVELLWATPASGFTAKIEEQRSDRITLEFRSNNHVSQIEARWSDGQPRTRVEEDDD